MSTLSQPVVIPARMRIVAVRRCSECEKLPRMRYTQGLFPRVLSTCSMLIILFLSVSRAQTPLPVPNGESGSQS